MKSFLLIISFLILSALSAIAQVVTTSPAFPRADEPVTITVDVTGTSLASFAWDNTSNPVWIWTWITEGCSSSCDAPTNVDPATSAQDAAKVARISANKYLITITPTTFFNKPADQIKKIGLKLKSRAWADQKETDNDRFIEFTEGGLALSLTAPSSFPVFKNTGDPFVITANTSEAATITIDINGGTVKTATAATTITYTHTVAGTASPTITVSATNGTETKETSFTYIVRTATANAPRPAGITDGINYTVDATRATLSLWAPNKTSVYVLGDFNDWTILPAYKMKKDGEHFWLELTGLTAGEEYAFQYLVDESLYVADPYADKILDPDDQYIPETTYPNLKAYPAQAIHTQSYFNRVAVLQTDKPTYTWQHTGFQKPVKENLVIYELHIRDFFDSDHRNYQTLIDTIAYLKNLGVSAIELMPITEFNGNDSWGYNPTFMFAPDKYYGTANKLREFVDVCHGQGMAVILDIVMNQQDLPNPYVLMYYDFVASKPTADNPWFNRDATHPFNVFFDMNHESKYTQAYLDTVNHYWLNQFHVDGFRFDLSKGFTQTNNPDDVAAWSAYDASRVAILERMADRIWSHTPDAYVILEHLAVNEEEKVLAEYRAGEGKGLMLWGNMNYAYNQATMGFSDGADISGVYYANRSWSVPHVVGYMESHDEERIMYKNEQYGNASGTYSVKNISTALDRVKAASLFFYTIPGPKMLWQFGELGYDLSINTCTDGTISNDCRVATKPVRWTYYEEENRKALYNFTANLLALRNQYTVFTAGTATLPATTGLTKQMTIKNTPYTDNPASAAQMNVQIVANFDVTQKSIDVTFPHTGIWYDYYTPGMALTVTAATKSVTLVPGAYKLYTDVNLGGPITGTEKENNKYTLSPYPNPTTGVFKIELSDTSLGVAVLDAYGRPVSFIRTGNVLDISNLAPGLYILKLTGKAGATTAQKIIKQ